MAYVSTPSPISHWAAANVIHKVKMQSVMISKRMTDFKSQTADQANDLTE